MTPPPSWRWPTTTSGSSCPACRPSGSPSTTPASTWGGWPASGSSEPTGPEFPVSPPMLAPSPASASMSAPVRVSSVATRCAYIAAWTTCARRRSTEMPIYALGDLVPVIAPDAYIHPDAVVIGNVSIGAESSVWPGAVLRGDMGAVVVGERTSGQDGTSLHTTAEWPTLIGSECVIGHNAHLEGCTVEDRCLIGSGSVVLNRAVVGTRSVVGAQALVVEDLDVRPGSMALGVPARIRP